MDEIETGTADPAGRAQEEAARQLVILAFSIVSVAALVWLQRHLSDPDLFKTINMRFSKAAERAHAKVAAWSWGRAEVYRKAYEDGRP